MLVRMIHVVHGKGTYGSLVSRAGHSRFGIRINDILQGVTGVMLIALGVRLAFEQK